MDPHLAMSVVLAACLFALSKLPLEKKLDSSNRPQVHARRPDAGKNRQPCRNWNIFLQTLLSFGLGQGLSCLFVSSSCDVVEKNEETAQTTAAMHLDGANNGTMRLLFHI
jgi:hypothetical protein